MSNVGLQEAAMNPQPLESLEAADAAETAIVPLKQEIGNKRREHAQSQVRHCVMISRKIDFNRCSGGCLHKH